MTSQSILLQRLRQQQLIGSHFRQPEALVHYMGAMQAQEYAMAKWAIGLRLPGQTDTSVEAAFNAGHILRTHVLRPTWHFVAPQDIRWMLQLTAPRVHAVNAFMYRKKELDNALLQRCCKLLEHKLRDHQYLSRSMLSQMLEQQGIESDTIRLSCIMMYAELEGLLCSGPREGKQFTYALLEERVAPAKPLTRDEALAALSLRYFTSRGPATVQDFAWWSGLTLKEARSGAASLPQGFVATELEGQTYLYRPPTKAAIAQLQTATFLMPDYDEYGISYKDRSALFTQGQQRGVASIFDHTIVVEGIIGGTWKQVRKGKQVSVHTELHKPYTAEQLDKVATASAHYLRFMNQPAT